MKGYSFDEEVEPLDVRLMSCNSQYIVMVLGGNEIICIDNISWNTELRGYLKHADEVVFLECSDSFIVVGHISGCVTVYVMTSRENPMTSRECKSLEITCEFRARLSGVKCVKIDDITRTIAMICDNDLTVYRDGVILHDISPISDVASFSWSKLLWDGKTPKDGIYQNLLQFMSGDQIVAVSPKKLYVFNIGNADLLSVKTVDIHHDHAECQKCYFWPSVVVSDKYICCRTSCSVRLYHKQTNKVSAPVLYKVFDKLYSPNERLIFPRDRVNLVGIGSKFLVTVDTHVFPRILIFDVETGTLITTVGNDRNECEFQIPIYHGIYHMSYFVALPFRSWLNGDFGDVSRPCLITYKHKDYLSDTAVWLFQLEKFRVRARGDRHQEFFRQCSKITTILEVRQKLGAADNTVPVQVG